MIGFTRNSLKLKAHASVDLHIFFTSSVKTILKEIERKILNFSHKSMFILFGVYKSYFVFYNVNCFVLGMRRTHPRTNVK